MFVSLNEVVNIIYELLHNTRRRLNRSWSSLWGRHTVFIFIMLYTFIYYASVIFLQFFVVKHFTNIIVSSSIY